MYQPGDTLTSNGATVVATHPLGDNEAIVLAIFRNEYVTWRQLTDVVELLEWGLYYGSDIDAAVTGYHDRCKRASTERPQQ